MKHVDTAELNRKLGRMTRVEYYTQHQDPTHTLAHDAVQFYGADGAEVVRVDDPMLAYIAPASAVLFRAWKVSEAEYAWQTPTMANPAYGKVGKPE